MSESEPAKKPYDERAAAWKPTMPPYDLFNDEKELLEQMKRGEHDTHEIRDGKIVPVES